MTPNKLLTGLNFIYIPGFSGISDRREFTERQIYETKCRKKVTVNFILYELNICLLEKISLGCGDNDDKYYQIYDDRYN